MQTVKTKYGFGPNCLFCENVRKSPQAKRALSTSISTSIFSRRDTGSGRRREATGAARPRPPSHAASQCRCTRPWSRDGRVTRCARPSSFRRWRVSRMKIRSTSSPATPGAGRPWTTTPREPTAATARRHRQTTPTRYGPSPRSRRTETRASRPWTTSPCTTTSSTRSSRTTDGIAPSPSTSTATPASRWPSTRSPSSLACAPACAPRSSTSSSTRCTR